MRVNFKNSLLTVARHLEGLFLRHAAMLGETLGRIVGASSRAGTRRARTAPARVARASRSAALRTPPMPERLLKLRLA